MGLFVWKLLKMIKVYENTKCNFELICRKINLPVKYISDVHFHFLRHEKKNNQKSNHHVWINYLGIPITKPQSNNCFFQVGLDLTITIPQLLKQFGGGGGVGGWFIKYIFLIIALFINKTRLLWYILNSWLVLYTTL